MEEDLYRLSPARWETTGMKPSKVYNSKVEIQCPLPTWCIMIGASVHGTHTLGHILQQKLAICHRMLQLLGKMSCPHSAGHKEPWRTASVIHRVTSAFNPRKSWGWNRWELWVEHREGTGQGTAYRQDPARDPGAQPREVDTDTGTDSNFMLTWIAGETLNLSGD